MGNIQKPRKHCLATHKIVMEMVGVFKENDVDVKHDKVAGTLKAMIDDTIIYQAIQKGAGKAHWIVTYRTDYLS